MEDFLDGFSDIVYVGIEINACEFEFHDSTVTVGNIERRDRQVAWKA